jgi:CheY-like chemotaxis protein
MNSPGSAPDQTILVVDDDIAVCQVMRLALGRTGYVVVSTDSPEGAVAAMRAHACPVAFIDLNLPGMSGLDLCRIITAEHPHTVAYLLTGYAPESVIYECRAAGFKDLLIKPVDLKVLAALADEACAAGTTAGMTVGGRQPHLPAGRSVPCKPC